MSLFLVILKYVLALGFLGSQVLVKLLFKLVKFIQEVIPFWNSQIIWLIFSSLLVRILGWAGLILYTSTLPTWTLTASTRSTFGVYGKTASIVFCVEHQKLFLLFLIFHLLFIILRLIISIMLFLIFQYALLHLLLGQLLVLVYDDQQFRLIYKVKGLIVDVLLWVLLHIVLLDLLRFV